MATGLPLRSITGFFKILKSSYECHRHRLGHAKYANLRKEVRSAFEASGQTFGYRHIWASLKRGGVRIFGKVVRRIMCDDGMRVMRPDRSRKYCSYKGEVTDAPANHAQRRFLADAPNELWPTDMFEFALPNGARVFLNPVIDAFDGAPVSWQIGRRPSKGLSDGSLRDAIARKRKGRILSSTPIGASTITSRHGSGSARKRGLQEACPGKGAAPTTPCAKGSSGV